MLSSSKALAAAVAMFAASAASALTPVNNNEAMIAQRLSNMVTMFRECKIVDLGPVPAQLDAYLASHTAMGGKAMQGDVVTMSKLETLNAFSKAGGPAKFCAGIIPLKPRAKGQMQTWWADLTAASKH